MRAILALLTILTLILGGCGSPVAPSPISAVATPASASPPGPAIPSRPPAATAATTPVAASPGESPSPSLVAVASPIALPKLSAKVPGATKIRYFPIVGESPGALIDDVVKRSKSYCKSDDTLACVLLTSKPSGTTVTYVATGRCTVRTARIALTSTVSLPRWAGPALVQPELLAWWRLMLDHMAWHEGQHIKIERSYDSKLKSLLVGHTCSSVSSIVKKWKRSLDAAQKRFDQQDLTWPYPDYTGPGGWYGTP